MPYRQKPAYPKPPPKPTEELRVMPVLEWSETVVTKRQVFLDRSSTGSYGRLTIKQETYVMLSIDDIAMLDEALQAFKDDLKVKDDEPGWRTAKWLNQDGLVKYDLTRLMDLGFLDCREGLYRINDLGREVLGKCAPSTTN